MSKAWFVTGTDTEVGKTAISCALLAAAAEENQERQQPGWNPHRDRPLQEHLLCPEEGARSSRR